MCKKQIWQVYQNGRGTEDDNVTTNYAKEDAGKEHYREWQITKLHILLFPIIRSMINN